MGTSMAAAATAAALALLRLAASPAFVPGCSGFPSKSVLRTASRPAALQEGCVIAASQSEASSQSSVAVGIAAVALLAAAASRRWQHTSSASRGGAKSLGVKAVAFPGSLVAASTSSAFAGGSLHKEAMAGRSSSRVAMGALKSMRLMFFKKWFTGQKKRGAHKLRNQAFNLVWKNRYRKQMKKVLRYAQDLQFGDSQPASLDEVMSNIKEELDEACELVDFVSVQGILHRNLAARRKDRMCKAILRGCIEKGIVKKPEKPLYIANEVLGYKMPKCYAVREPRPWQLPGWKTPWELKREFDKWELDTGRRFEQK